MISVIIPLYNKEQIIERTLKSVLSQNYDDFEVVVVNDGSTDKSAAIVRQIDDSRIRLIEQENGGPSKARNTGTKNAKGDWILYLDADDELLPDSLSIFSNLTMKHPDADIIDCGQKINNGNSVTIMKHTLEGYSKNPMRDWYFNRIGPGTNHSLFKTSIIKQYPYNELIRRFEDAELLSRILRKTKVYSSSIATALVHAEFSSASHPKKDIKDDFLGHLNMRGGDFWYKMCVYKTFIEERENYFDQCRNLYSNLYKRYDLLLIYKLLPKLKFLFS